MDRNQLVERNFEELKTISAQIHDALNYLNNYCDNLNSKTIKDIVSQNLNLGFASFLVLKDVVLLYKEYFKHSISEDYKFINDTVNFVNQQNDLISKATDEEIKKIMIATALKFSSYNKSKLEIQLTISEINYTLLEYSILFSAYNLYNALNLVNNKFKKQNVQIRTKELKENVLSFSPVGPINDLINFIINIAELINAVEEQNAGERFVFAADNAITLLEKQSECLQLSYQGLLSMLNTIKSLSNANVETVDN